MLFACSNQGVFEESRTAGKHVGGPAAVPDGVHTAAGVDMEHRVGDQFPLLYRYMSYVHCLSYSFDNFISILSRWGPIRYVSYAHDYICIVIISI